MSGTNLQTFDTGHAQRMRVTIRGAVQGVGFRPFIYRLATELGLAGRVGNSSQGAYIEVEGSQQQLQGFLFRIDLQKPPRCSIHSLEYSLLDAIGYTHFEIMPSDAMGEKTTLVMPDIATCRDCLREIFNPGNRRYRYPFTNCTNCGPRFSIVELLPYDRPGTTMKRFVMCSQCQSEYDSPTDRRFHAQPNACPECGPHLELWDCDGRIVASRHEALLAAAGAIRDGAVAAVKGLGGFHLIIDARNEKTVERLRQRKRREEKPFALMYPSIEYIKLHCEVSELEERLLSSPESPIVLLRRRNDFPNREIALSVAPGNPYLGVMLPYTPLHHLLLAELGFPVVATSGNLSDEPICIDEHEALRRLGGIAEMFLVHDRPIVQHVDDSIVRVIMGRELILRRARGYAPLPVQLKDPMPGWLGVGAQLKNAVAMSVDRAIFISQHIGDLETTQAFDAFQHVIKRLQQLYDSPSTAIACDMHPDYLSTKFAREYGFPTVRVQHHAAHVLSCMAENELVGRVLGIAWDGTGYGLDGSIWGGEFLHVTESSFIRSGHLRTFRLPGGEKAIKQPKRAAVGLLYELMGDDIFEMKEIAPVQGFSSQEVTILRTMLERKVNSPVTSSAGRLFDGVASIVGIRHTANFEGQAAMELEFALEGSDTEEAYPVEILEGGPPIAAQYRSNAGTKFPNSKSTYILDWGPMLQEILNDLNCGIPVGRISARFHNALVETIVAMAYCVAEERVVLTGGCFQNRYLAERGIRRLRKEGFQPYWHQRIPPNDGGIAAGQLVAVQRGPDKIRPVHRL